MKETTMKKIKYWIKMMPNLLIGLVILIGVIGIPLNLFFSLRLKPTSELYYGNQTVNSYASSERNEILWQPNCPEIDMMISHSSKKISEAIRLSQLEREYIDKNYNDAYYNTWYQIGYYPERFEGFKIQLRAGWRDREVLKPHLRYIKSLLILRDLSNCPSKPNIGDFQSVSKKIFVKSGFLESSMKSNIRFSNSQPSPQFFVIPQAYKK